MRTGAFSDEKVVERLGRDFVCVWKNIRPAEPYVDTLYGEHALGSTKKLERGAGDQNVCAHVVTSEGRILHAVQGFVDAPQLLEELDFAEKAGVTGARGLSKLYADRAALLKEKECRGLQLLRKNLLQLADDPLPKLHVILDRTTAGLGR